MQNLKIPDKLKNELRKFIAGLKEIYPAEIISIVLYGSAASGEFINKHSNLNLLVVLKNTDHLSLAKAAGLVRKFKNITPLFMTKDYIHSCLGVFPIEFLDMKENHRLLEGEDLLRNIDIDTKNLRFQCEQELRSKLINLKQNYLVFYRDFDALKALLFKAITSVLHISRNTLRLKNQKAPYLKDEILKEIGREFGLDIALWQRILDAKNKKIKLDRQELRVLFGNFIDGLEKIVAAVGRL